MRIEGPQRWCKSHCLNIGIWRATSKYVLISDVDIMFTQDYIADAVKLLRDNTTGVVYSVCRDLQETDALAVLSDDVPPGPQLDELASRTTRRFVGHSYGICLTRRLYFNLLHGYDEAYVGWGAEDADIAKRFRYLGLNEMILTGSSCYLHQWHPKWEGIKALPHLKSLIIANAQYLDKRHSIVRNRRGWGAADASVHM
jgi:predicted glycosyltransferase involved in capsule biosynthesis